MYAQSMALRLGAMAKNNFVRAIPVRVESGNAYVVNFGAHLLAAVSYGPPPPQLTEGGEEKLFIEKVRARKLRVA